MHEDRDAEEEIIHKPLFKGRKQTHILIGHYAEGNVQWKKNPYD